jgi:hypothetical protein
VNESIREVLHGAQEKPAGRLLYVNELIGHML